MPVLLLPSGSAAPTTPGYPSVKIEIQFTQNTWTDVSQYYDSSGGQQISITRGSSRVESPVIRYDAGTCTIPLVNTDRRFDPTNLAGPYVSTGGGASPFQWLADGSTIHTMFGVDPATTKFFFNNPNGFLFGSSPAVNPVQDGLAATPVLNYKSYAQLQSDITGSVINTAIFTWLLYDIEGGAGWPTPLAEQQDPQTAMANFCTLAHAHGFKVILTPGRDLANTDTAHPRNPGESNDSWYLRTGIATAAGAAGDIFEVQDQANTQNPAEFVSFFNQAFGQARAANPAIPVWCGLSTNWGTPAQNWAAAQSVPKAQGFWFNMIGDVPNSDAFFILAQPGPGAVATLVRPVVPVRVSATYAGVTYRLFTGTADSWTLSYSAPYDAQVTLQATDGFKLLAANHRSGKVVYQGPGEDAGRRCTRILDDTGWPSAQRSITPGDATLQPTLLSFTAPGLAFNFNPPGLPGRGSGTNVPDWTLVLGGGGPPDTGVPPVNLKPAVPTSTPLDELYLTADTEMGEMYVDGNGFLNFRHRNAIWLDARSTTSQATFGDSTATGGQFLLGDDAGFEGGTGHWVADTNSTIANSVAQAHSGTHSLAITSVAAGNAAANSGTQRAFVQTGDTLTLQGWFRAATAARTCEVLVNWLRADLTFITTVSVASVTDSTSAWTFATGTAAAPPGAAFAQAIARIDATGAANEVHYFDDTFMSVAAELPYASLTPAYDDSTLWNGAVIANAGGVLQQASDATSQQQPPMGNGPHVFDNQNLIADTDWQSLGYAQWIVATSKTAELRFSQMTVNPVGDPNAANNPVPPTVFPQVLGRQIGDQITCNMRPPGGGTVISRTVLIRGIQHAFTESNWLTTWIFQDLTNYPQPFIIGDTVNGVLDQSLLGF